MLAKQQQFGFTLVELMLTVAVFVILASFAIPSFQEMVQNSKTRNAAESVHTGLQIARSEAVKRNTNVQFDFRGSNSAWTVCTSPATAGGCPGADNATTIQSRAMGEGSSTDIAITATPAGPYVYSSLGVMVSPAPAAGLVKIEVKNSAATSGRNLRVEIGTGGSVRVCDPQLTDANDPRKCS
jgi:type IV fimbrial biogenesis protein FimT